MSTGIRCPDVDCGHLMAAHDGGVVTDFLRCRVDGCGCEQGDPGLYALELYGLSDPLIDSREAARGAAAEIRRLRTSLAQVVDLVNNFADPGEIADVLDAQGWTYEWAQDVFAAEREGSSDA